MDHVIKRTECHKFYTENKVELPAITEKGLKSNVKRKRKGTVEEEEMQIDGSGDHHVDSKGSMTVAEIYERDCNEFKEDGNENTRHASFPENRTLKKKYPLDFKIKAIDDVESETKSGYDDDPSILKVSKALEINKNLLRKWWTNKDKIKKVYQLFIKKSKMENKLESSGSNNLHSIENLLSEGIQNLSSPVPGSEKKIPRVYCRTCPGCKTPDCGECRNCKDKPKFGGPNKIRQRCLNKPPCQMKDEKRRQSASSYKLIESNQDDNFSHQESSFEEESDVQDKSEDSASDLSPEPHTENETNAAEETLKTEVSCGYESLDNSYSNEYYDFEPEKEEPLEANSSVSDAQCSSESDDKNKGVNNQIEDEVADNIEVANQENVQDQKDKESFDESDDSLFLEETDEFSSPVVGSGKKKNGSCKSCPGCLAPECGNCKYCLDKPRFGGKNRLRQRCVMKACHLKMKNVQPRKRLSSQSAQKHLQSKRNSSSEDTHEESELLTPDYMNMHKATKSVAFEEIEDTVSLESNSSKISQHWWNSVPQFDEERKEDGQNEITINVQEKIETINSENNEIVNIENTTTKNQIEQSYEFSEEQKVCDLEKENFSNVLDRVFPNHLPSGLQIIPKKRKLKKETQESLQSYEGGYSVRSRNHPSCYDDNVNVTIKRVKRKRESQPPDTKWKREIKYSESDQMGPDQFYPGQQPFQNYNYQNINFDRQTPGQTFTPCSAGSGTIKTELAPILSDTNSVQSPQYNDSVELEEYVNNDDVLNILDSKNSVQPAMNDIKQELGEISNVMDNSPNAVKMEQVDSQSAIDYSQTNKRVVTMFPVYLPEPNGLDPQDDKLFKISRSQMEKFRSVSMLVVRNEITLRDAALASGMRKFIYLLLSSLSQNPWSQNPLGPSPTKSQ